MRSDDLACDMMSNFFCPTIAKMEKVSHELLLASPYDL
jgi:hypothetical protein